MNNQQLRQKVSPIILVDLTSRELTLIYVHEFSRSMGAEDLHPCTYLHYAPALEQWRSDYKLAVQEGRERPRLQILERVIERIEKKTDYLRPRYEEQKERYRSAYVEFAILKMLPIDLIVCFPSDRPEAHFYHEAVANASRVNNPNAIDLTPFFKKEAQFKIGKEVNGKNVTIKEAFQKITFAYNGSLAGIRNVLLVDDAWATGTTAGVVVSHLHNKGLPANSHITVFVPLVVPQQNFVRPETT